MEKPTFNKLLQVEESPNLMTKVFTDTCCESCSCKSESDHKNSGETESGFTISQ